MKIKRWDNDEVIFEDDAETVVETLENGVRQGVSFYRAELNDAELNDAELNRAELNDAELNDAKLNDAKLNDAKLNDAELNRAEGIIWGGWPNGWQAYAWLRDDWLSVRVGCREFRLSEAREYWTGKDDRREVMAILDYFEAVARIRRWAMTEEEVENLKAKAETV